MARTYEDDEDDLCRAEDLAADGSCDDLACVCHVVDVWVS